MVSILCFSLFMLLPLLSAEEAVPAALESSAEIRATLAGASLIRVYEGLPHQSFERDLLAKESQRKDTKVIGSFRFYTPAVEAKNLVGLRTLLSSSEAIQVFRGEKRCGGFHPDYAIEWLDGAGNRYDAQICFGCHEVIYRDGKNEYRYDLKRGSLEKLKKELAGYAKKRPKKIKSDR